MELNGTHQLLVYAHDINLLGDSVNITKENTKSLLESKRRWVVSFTAPPLYPGTHRTGPG